MAKGDVDDRLGGFADRVLGCIRRYIVPVDFDASKEIKARIGYSLQARLVAVRGASGPSEPPGVDVDAHGPQERIARTFDFARLPARPYLQALRLRIVRLAKQLDLVP